MRGLVTLGIQDVLMAGATVRLVMRQQGGDDFFVELPGDNLYAAMPSLIRAANASIPNGSIAATTTVAVEVDLDPAGDVLLTFQNTAGARSSYGLSRPIALRLSALLDSALARQSGSSEVH